MEALRKYGSKKEDGSLEVDERNNIRIEGDNLKKFAKELSELTSVDVDIASIRVDELGDECELTTEELMFLEGVVVD